MRGPAQVKAFMAEHKLGHEDMFVSKFPEHVRLRKQLMNEMLASGLRVSEISRALDLGPEAVKYHTNPEWRRRRLDKRLGRYVCGKQIRDLTLALEAFYG